MSPHPVTAKSLVRAEPFSLLGKAKFQVPEQFGLGAIIGMLTIYSLFFAALRVVGAPPQIYFFVGSLGILVCLSQMVLGSVPRGASLLVGAIYLPLWCLVYAVWKKPRLLGFVLTGIPCISIGGAFVGYATGTLAAGCFMAVHLLESSILRWRDVDLGDARIVSLQKKNDVSREQSK